eukprot:1142301-Pelagomonas_calceolata.AAC.2
MWPDQDQAYFECAGSFQGSAPGQGAVLSRNASKMPHYCWLALEHSPNRPPPACSRWPPGHSGHILGTPASLGVQLEDRGTQGSTFRWDGQNWQRWPGWQKVGCHTGLWRLTFGPVDSQPLPSHSGSRLGCACRCEELYGPSTLVRNIRPPTRARDRGYHTGSSEEGHRRTFNS